MAVAYRTADATVSAFSAIAVTLSDSTVLNITRALYIGVGGNLKVTTANNEAVTFSNLAQGTILPIQVSQCWSTGTTASSILALY